MSRPLQIERLTELSRAFTYATSLKDILDLAVRQAAEMLGAEKAILLLPNEEGVLQVSASYGVSVDVVRRFRESLDESLAARILNLFGTEIAEGFIGVPLVSAGSVTGLLAVLRPQNGDVTDDEEWLLSALADQVAAPIENARMTEQVEKAALLTENARLYESERAARKEAEDALELAQESDRSKAAFLAAMSHDLRTPLNAIGGYVEILRMGLRGPVTEEQAADLDRIGTNQKHLLSIVSDVLDFAKMGAGRLTYSYVDVPLASALQDVEDAVLPQIEKKGIVYRRESGDDSIVCVTDPDKLRQILTNLLTNATKFTPEGGTITTRVEAVTDGAVRMAQIHVCDTGSGIPAEKLASAFLPFVQINRKLSHPDEGIGLGLAISRDLANGLGGDLTAVSTFGEGSTFTLTLPIKP